MKKTIFRVEKMDCPSEERLIRMKLAELVTVRRVNVDLANRRVDVFHDGDSQDVTAAIDSLRLEATFSSSEEAVLEQAADDTEQRKILITVLAINAGFFLVELVTGIIAHSMGLIADSLDMLADALVYGLSLYAIGHALAKKKAVAKYSGYLQICLAIFGFVEVVRRFFWAGELPEVSFMIAVSIFALLGNLVSLWLLTRSRNNEVHMQASRIFTSNDVLANLGVILAGGIVFLTDSKIPDLVVGTLIFFIVVRGAYRILQISK